MVSTDKYKCMVMFDGKHVYANHKFHKGDIIEMCHDVVELTTYCLESYEVNIIDNTYLKPYLDMKAFLDAEKVDGFMNRLEAIYSSIPSSINKGKLNEAWFHSVAHSVMYQFGFTRRVKQVKVEKI